MTGRLPHPSELRWSEFAQRTPHYVLSTTLQSFAWPQTRVLRHADAVRDLKAEAGKDIYLMGGATMLGNLLDAGLVDELHCILYPLLTGQAKGPFAALTQRRQLRLQSQQQMGEGKIHLAYRVE
jgi:dihydrofolate reductase